MDQDINETTLDDPHFPVETEVSISVLGEIVKSLMNAVWTLQTLREVEMNALFKNLELSFPKDGIDYYQAKRLYEVNLIKQALRQTSGHQSKAAKLLKIRTSTLNSIIKKNNISV